MVQIPSSLTIELSKKLNKKINFKIFPNNKKWNGGKIKENEKSNKIAIFRKLLSLK